MPYASKNKKGIKIPVYDTKAGFKKTKIKDWTDQQTYSQKEMPKEEFTKKPSK